MKPNQRKFKIAIVVTVGLSLDKLFPDFYDLVEKEGFEVIGICAYDKYVQNVLDHGVRVIELPMTREFTPLRDIYCLYKLYNIFRKEKFDLIHYSTPKAALLSAIAGKLCHSSIKLYTMRGLVYVGFTGMKRFIAKLCEKIATRFADYVIAISQSLKEEAVKENIAKAEHIHVFGSGSSKGVNLEQFSLNEHTINNGLEIRHHLGITKNDVVIGYAGRLTTEKGIAELLDAFKSITVDHNNTHIIFVGDMDERMPLPEDLQLLIKNESKVHVLPFTEDLPSHLAAMDIFVLASYREGFGNVLIEASAMQKPVIATDIPGCCDAVKPGETGELVTVRDSVSLEKALRRLITDKTSREAIGINGRLWVEKEFVRDVVWCRLIDTYKALIAEKHVHE